MNNSSRSARDASERIPFLDLVTPHHELKDELQAVVARALHAGFFIGGAMLEEFENAFAGYCGTTFCIGVSSGTDAVRFALMAAGVTAGDAVITVPNTFVATCEAISQAGAQPFFVDVNPQTYNMDHRKLQDFLESRCQLEATTGKLIVKETNLRVAAIVPVHLYGQMADMDPILELADRYQLKVIEDACQAHGAKYFSRPKKRWLNAGSMGHAAAFSFYPGKNLGACGEAGAVTTRDPALAATVRKLRDHGQTQKYYHAIEGYNGRMDAIQAGFLSCKLRHLDKWNTSRSTLAQRYNQIFTAAAPVVLPFEPSWSRAVYHLYVLQVDDRKAAQRELERRHIGSGIHYPIPLHLQQAYERLGYTRGDFPVAEEAAERILSLPMFPTLREAEQRRVVSAVLNSASCGLLTKACA